MCPKTSKLAVVAVDDESSHSSVSSVHLTLGLLREEGLEPWPTVSTMILRLLLALNFFPSIQGISSFNNYTSTLALGFIKKIIYLLCTFIFPIHITKSASLVHFFKLRTNSSKYVKVEVTRVRSPVTWVLIPNDFSVSLFKFD